MIGLAERLRSHQNLPDARLVWLEARLAAERRLAERALRPIAYTRVVGSFAAVVTLVLATVWAWPALFDGGSAQWLAALARTPSVVVAAAIGGLAVLASRKLL
jgi:hypothetical protein